MEQSAATIRVRKDETTRLYEELTDGGVIGTLAYETTGGRCQTTVGIYCGSVADYVQGHPEFNDAVDINRSAFIATRTTRVTNSRP